MKKIFLLSIFLMFILPIPLPGHGGAYNSVSHLIYCKNDYHCYHENAHKMDQELDWISHTEDFSFAIYTYIFYELRQDAPSHLAVELIEKTFMEPNKYMPFSDVNAEAYAIIFAHAQGRPENMPEIFREFYDWELAEELIAKYIGE